MSHCKFILVCVAAIVITGCDQKQATEPIPSTDETRPIEPGTPSGSTPLKSAEEAASPSQLPELDLNIFKDATSKSTHTKAVDSITTTERQRLERYLLSNDKFTSALEQQAPKNELELLRLERTQALREVANEVSPIGKYYQGKLIYLQQGKQSYEEFAWYLKSAKEGYVPAFDKASVMSGSIKTDNAWWIVKIHANAVAIESGDEDLMAWIGSNSTERHDWLHNSVANILNQPNITDDFKHSVLSETQNLVETISKYGYTYEDGTILVDPDLEIWKKEKVRIKKTLGL